MTMLCFQERFRASVHLVKKQKLEGMANVVIDRLQAMKNKHAITLERLKIDVLKGIILNADKKRTSESLR